jgi:hypothetical protein
MKIEVKGKKRKKYQAKHFNGQYNIEGCRRLIKALLNIASRNTGGQDFSALTGIGSDAESVEQNSQKAK